MKFIKDFLNKETKITVLKFFSIFSILVSIFLQVTSSNINIKNNLNNLDGMNNDIDSLIKNIKKTLKINNITIFYFLFVLLFGIYKYKKFGNILKVKLLFISAFLGFIIKNFVIILDKACINELNMFKLYINGEIELNDTNPNITNKLNLYYFDFDSQTTSNDTQAETETETEIETEIETETKTKTAKSKKYKISKDTKSVYQRIKPVLSSSYYDKIELFTALVANNKNFDKIQSFLDNSLVLKYQKYLILVYITQIFINMTFLYVPVFV